jgi:hypothetical protein
MTLLPWDPLWLPTWWHKQFYTCPSATTCHSQDPDRCLIHALRPPNLEPNKMFVLKSKKDDCEHPLLYLPGTGIASNKTAIPGSLHQNLAVICNNVWVWWLIMGWIPGWGSLWIVQQVPFLISPHILKTLWMQAHGLPNQLPCEFSLRGLKNQNSQKQTNKQTAPHI